MTKKEAIKRLMDESCKSRLYCELYPDDCMKEECEIYMAIEALKERPKGKWIVDRYDSRGVCCCNNCFKQFAHISIDGGEVSWNFCPNCGSFNGGDNK